MIEAVIGVPAFMLFVALIIFAGRTAIAHQAVQSAAASAARSASIARTQAQAGADAHSAGAASLTNQDVHCVTKTITEIADIRIIAFASGRSLSSRREIFSL